MKKTETIETWACDEPGCSARARYPTQGMPPIGWVDVSFEAWESDAELNRILRRRNRTYCGEHSKAIMVSLRALEP